MVARPFMVHNRGQTRARVKTVGTKIERGEEGDASERCTRSGDGGDEERGGRK